MHCPSCGNILQKLAVTTDSGGKFEVDHCGRCGGTWFDPYEINRIPYFEVLRLAGLSTPPQNMPEFLPKTYCPLCHSEMEIYAGESVKKGISLMRCPKDKGIWATQKALMSFKQSQEQTIKEYKVKKTAFPAMSVVFVPAIFMLALFVGTFVTVTHLQEAREQRTQASALVIRQQAVPLSGTTVSITFETKSEVKSSVSYGTSSLEMTSKEISLTPKTKHSILLTGLKPQTTYIYKLIMEDDQGRKSETEKQSFMTR